MRMRDAVERELRKALEILTLAKADEKKEEGAEEKKKTGIKKVVSDLIAALGTPIPDIEAKPLDYASLLTLLRKESQEALSRHGFLEYMKAIERSIRLFLSTKRIPVVDTMAAYYDTQLQSPQIVFSPNISKTIASLLPSITTLALSTAPVVADILDRLYNKLGTDVTLPTPSGKKVNQSLETHMKYVALWKALLNSNNRRLFWEAFFKRQRLFKLTTETGQQINVDIALLIEGYRYIVDMVNRIVAALAEPRSAEEKQVEKKQEEVKIKQETALALEFLINFSPSSLKSYLKLRGLDIQEVSPPILKETILPDMLQTILSDPALGVTNPKDEAANLRNNWMTIAKEASQRMEQSFLQTEINRMVWGMLLHELFHIERRDIYDDAPSPSTAMFGAAKRILEIIGEQIREGKFNYDDRFYPVKRLWKRSQIKRENVSPNEAFHIDVFRYLERNGEIKGTTEEEKKALISTLANELYHHVRKHRSATKALHKYLNIGQDATINKTLYSIFCRGGTQIFAPLAALFTVSFGILPEVISLPPDSTEREILLHVGEKFGELLLEPPQVIEDGGNGFNGDYEKPDDEDGDYGFNGDYEDDDTEDGDNGDDGGNGRKRRKEKEPGRGRGKKGDDDWWEIDDEEMEEASERAKNTGGEISPEEDLKKEGEGEGEDEKEKEKEQEKEGPEKEKEEEGEKRQPKEPPTDKDELERLLDELEKLRRKLDETVRIGRGDRTAVPPLEVLRKPPYYPPDWEQGLLELIHDVVQMAPIKETTTRGPQETQYEEIPVVDRYGNIDVVYTPKTTGAPVVSFSLLVDVSGSMTPMIETVVSQIVTFMKNQIKAKERQGGELVPMPVPSALPNAPVGADFNFTFGLLTTHHIKGKHANAYIPYTIEIPQIGNALTQIDTVYSIATKATGNTDILRATAEYIDYLMKLSEPVDSPLNGTPLILVIATDAQTDGMIDVDSALGNYLVGKLREALSVFTNIQVTFLIYTPGGYPDESVPADEARRLNEARREYFMDKVNNFKQTIGGVEPTTESDTRVAFHLGDITFRLFLVDRLPPPPTTEEVGFLPQEGAPEEEKPTEEIPTTETQPTYPPETPEEAETEEQPTEAETETFQPQPTTTVEEEAGSKNTEEEGEKEKLKALFFKAFGAAWRLKSR